MVLFSVRVCVWGGVSVKRCVCGVLHRMLGDVIVIIVDSGDELVTGEQW